jgi:hypothetical protein
MRSTITLAFVFCLIFSACKKKENIILEEKIDFNEASVKLMDTIRPDLYGTWKMKEVNVKPFAPQTSEIGIYKDTTLIDFAILNITSVNNYSKYNQVSNDVTGVLEFQHKSYPVGFTMRATGDRIFKKQGPQIFALFEFRFLVGSHPTEKEEDYLQSLTLIGNNYTIEISSDGQKMVWKGLNRAIKEIQFVKN